MQAKKKKLWTALPVKEEFEQLDMRLSGALHETLGNFELSKIKHLPKALQRFFVYSRLIGKPMMRGSVTIHRDVDFLLTEGKPRVKIQYIQHNYAQSPQRIAFIDTKMYGIPFQGLDSYVAGEGCMKGVLAKRFCLFEQRSQEMNQAGLVTVLAESIVCPSALLMPEITWEEIDETHVGATITDQGVSASGIFTLSEEGALISFRTEDRYEIDSQGKSVRTPWTAACGNYVAQDGIKRPTSFRGIWNRPDEDLVYFACDQVSVEYRY